MFPINSVDKHHLVVAGSVDLAANLGIVVCGCSTARSHCTTVRCTPCHSLRAMNIIAQSPSPGLPGGYACMQVTLPENVC